MIIPKSFSWCNIGRFIEPQTIDFFALGSLTQMDAEIKGTGRSSGAGKTTVFNAFEYCLGLNDLPNSVLQSRLTKEGMWTKTVVDWDGVEVTIERGKSKFAITTPDGAISGNSKITEAKLDEMFGMPRKLMRQVLHKRQGEGGFFLSMGPAETGKFLTKCLQLETEQAKIDGLDLRIKPFQDKEILLKNKIAASIAARDATQTAIQSLPPTPVLAYDPDQKKGELLTKVNEAEGAQKLLEDVCQTEIDCLEADRPQPIVIPYDRSKIVQIELEIPAYSSKIAEYEKRETLRVSQIDEQINLHLVTVGALSQTEHARVAGVRGKIDELNATVKHLTEEETKRVTAAAAGVAQKQVDIFKTQALIETGNKALESAKVLGLELQTVRGAMCPTCSQGWITDAAKAKEQEIVAKLEEYKKQVMAAVAAKKTLETLNAEITELKSASVRRLIPGAAEIDAQLAQHRIDSEFKIPSQVQELNTKIVQLRIDKAPQVNSEIAPIRAKINEKNQELVKLRQEEQSHQTSENNKNTAMLLKYNQRASAVRASHSLALDAARSYVTNAKNELTQSDNEIKNHSSSLASHKVTAQKLQTELDNHNQKMATDNAELEKVQLEIELNTESKKVIKSFLSCKFEEALESISKDATDIVRSIPNMATATIQFDGLKETQEGKIKEEVTCTISMDGELAVPLKSLSGGEGSSADLAIDLSVIKFIEEKTGKGIRLFIIDEGFTGMDPICIEEAIEMLQGIDKKILLVDHNEVASQKIENRIVVVRDGLTSTISQQ